MQNCADKGDKAIYNKLEQIPLVQKKFDKIQRDTWLK